ncbi:hypothetical protein [Halorubrum persicum]|uniref:hypothetical protein n=1 Tax=Halorubrum persicum TaxID=1383844 RepID=UPI001181A42A|nr:hypothetical protein [Halorubrum persicum]
MANRRKFIAGLGALATGSAAAMGTGAFSSVRAERAINVSTAGDSGAYLGLDASTSVYAKETGDTLELQFDGSNSNQNGNGLNANADTTFTNVMRIENNGTNTVRLQLGDDDNGTSAIGILPDGPMVVSYTDNELTSDALADSTPFAAVPSVPSHWSNSADVASQDLAPGDDLYVHFGFYLNGDIQSLGSTASTSLSDVPDDIGFYADGSSEDGSDFSSS